MIIKKFKDYTKESFGEEIEKLYQEDEYIRNIINRYIDEVDPFIRIANVVNTLDQSEQDDIEKQVNQYLESGIEEKEPVVTATTDIELLESMAQDEISKAGKGVFHSFLKSITALGGSENSPNVEICPSDFLMFYQIDNLDLESVKVVFNRFKSLTSYVNMIDYTRNVISLYFGIKSNGYLEYGIKQDEILMIGQFRLSKSTINWILKLESKSARSLKKKLVDLSYGDILTMGKIKNEMKSYSPGYFTKKTPGVIKNRVITFGYYGFGKWNNGKIENSDYLNFKNLFDQWISNRKWASKVLYSINFDSFWLYIHIKIK